MDKTQTVYQFFRDIRVEGDDVTLIERDDFDALCEKMLKEEEERERKEKERGKE